MRSIVQERLDELNERAIPILRAEMTNHMHDVSIIRLGTLDDSKVKEVRELNNRRWAIPIYNLPHVTDRLFDRLKKLLPPDINPEIRQDSSSGLTEIYFTPIDLQALQPAPDARVAYDLRDYPQERSSRLVPLFLLLLIVSVGSYFLYSYILKEYERLPTKSDQSFTSHSFPERWTPYRSENENVNSPIPTTSSMPSTKPQPELTPLNTN